MATEITQLQYHKKRLKLLHDERSPHDSHTKELYDFFMPRRGRALKNPEGGNEAGKGSKKHQNIINGTGLYAAKTFASGFMAGASNPATIWYHLTTPDKEMMEFGPVREWLFFVEADQRHVMSNSNYYDLLYLAYLDLGISGTFGGVINEDREQVIRCHSFAPGRYYIAQSDKGKVDTIYRRQPMTVRQMVDQFGEENVSTTVLNMYQRQNYDQWRDTIQAIEPNTTRIPGLADSQNMRWRSNWFEPKSNEGKLLRQSGFNEWPGAAPRWLLPDEDTYGSSPGMDALGDNKALQLQERRKAQAIDKLVDPPMVATPELRNSPSTLLPGGVTYASFTATGGAPGFQPAYTIKPDIGALLDDISSTEARVNREMYVDLFRMLIDTTRREITAREVEEKAEEKLSLLGPSLTRMNGELYIPTIDRIFAISLRAGRYPIPPRELEGVPLKVEFISILHQAQRRVQTQGIERTAGFVLSLRDAFPEVVDKFNYDEAVEEYGEAMAIPPKLIRPDDQTAEIRARRAEQQQLQELLAVAEPAEQASQAVKNISEVAR